MLSPYVKLPWCVWKTPLYGGQSLPMTLRILLFHFQQQSLSLGEMEIIRVFHLRLRTLYIDRQ